MCDNYCVAMKIFDIIWLDPRRRQGMDTVSTLLVFWQGNPSVTREFPLNLGSNAQLLYLWCYTEYIVELHSICGGFDDMTHMWHHNKDCVVIISDCITTRNFMFWPLLVPLFSCDVFYHGVTYYRHKHSSITCILHISIKCQDQVPRVSMARLE